MEEPLLRIHDPVLPSRDPDALREDLGREYYAILGVVSDFDGRFLVVKGWSVTLSLVALGLGFKEQHAAYFALAAFSGLCLGVLFDVPGLDRIAW